MLDRLVILASGLLALLLAGGCATTASLDRAIADYEAGRFSLSLAEAERAANQGDAVSRDEAAYLAGLSAYRRGRDAEARRWLSSSARSSDDWLAGQSLVTLGSVENRGGDLRAAARAFTRAAERLPDADEAARARAAAGWAYRELGDDANAREQFSLAKVPASGPVPPTPAPPRSPPSPAGRPPAETSPAATAGAFTIQAGAFREADRARDRAGEIAPKARSLGLGAPIVRTKSSGSGGSIWVVQVGRFPDRASAEKVKSRLGTVNLSVERAPTGG